MKNRLGRTNSISKSNLYGPVWLCTGAVAKLAYEDRGDGRPARGFCPCTCLYEPLFCGERVLDEEKKTEQINWMLPVSHDVLLTTIDSLVHIQIEKDERGKECLRDYKPALKKTRQRILTFCLRREY